MGNLHMPPPATNDYDDTLPLPRSHLDRNHDVGAHLFEIENNLKGMISSDLTGRFPYTYSRGMTYLFILYDYDSNAILASPIKSRSAGDIVVGYEFCYRQLSAAGISPILQLIDNEASTALFDAITTKNCLFSTTASPPMPCWRISAKYSLLPPHSRHTHQRRRVKLQGCRRL
jgi:hypothetical protein